MARRANDTLTVKIGLALIQLIDIVSVFFSPCKISFKPILQTLFKDELNQVMTTNVWLYQEWQDHHLSFDPDEYNGIQKMDVPAHMIWLPGLLKLLNH